MKNAHQPYWFRTLTKQLDSNKYVNEYAAKLTASIGQCNWATHYKHLSIMDIQHGINQLTNAYNSTGASNPNVILNKGYISDHVRKHTWRNSTQFGEVDLQFYQLVARRDYPNYTISTASLGDLPDLAPPSSDAYTAGGHRLSPSFMNLAANQVPTSFGPSTTIIQTGNLAYTPWMNPMLSRMFKIKPLKVDGPSGHSSNQHLLPGSECSFVGKKSKPYMVSLSKFGIFQNEAGGSAAAFQMATMYQFLRETPLILVKLKGSVAHDTSSGTSIDRGPVWVDYKQEQHCLFWALGSTLYPAGNVWTTSRSSVVTAEQESLVTGATGTMADP